MLKKWIASLIVLTSVCLVLVGCGTNTKEDEQSSQRETEKVYTNINEFVEALKDVNKDLKSVHTEAKVDLYNIKDAAPEQKIVMTADTIYEKQGINRIDIMVESSAKTGEIIGYGELIVPNETEAYSRESKDEKYKKEKIDKEYLDELDSNPGYFDLLNCIYDNASDLSIEEDGSDYVITMNGNNISLLNTFGKEYNFKLNNITEDEMKKELIIRFNKSSLLMNELQVALTYEGEKGYIKISAVTEFSEFNEIKEADIKAPN